MAYPMQPIVVTAATSLNQDSHAGNTLVLNSTTGRIITLPASSGKGDVYTVYIQATVSSGSHVVQVANGTDTMGGGVAVTTDVGGTVAPATGTSDTITMSGSTSGGLAGSWCRFTDVAAGVWLTEGILVATGTEISPFSAAVS